MKRRVVLLIALLILVSGCYAGTEPVLRKDLDLVADNFEGLRKETRLRISDAALSY